MNDELRALGRTIAELEDEALGARERPSLDVRVESLRRTQARRGAALRRVRLAVPLALAAIAAGMALLFWPRATEPLTFTVGGRDPGALGVWVSAPPAAQTVLAFSDGSRVLLGAGAQARVIAASERGARVVVERGKIRADVVPRAGNDWWVVGGPFEIHVTGTSFDASWEPLREELRVSMHEGHVDVHGACLPRPRSLSRGQSATIACPSPAGVASAARAEAAMPSAAPASPSLQPPAVVAAAPRPTAVPLRGLPSVVAPAEPSAPAPAEPSWQAWARLGAYREAISAAEGTGFGSLCTTLSLAELLELATTARLAGKTARATEAYSAVRARFAGTDGAATAAFHLGQMAFDGVGAYPEAHRWFATYLAERPAGSLAAEALGRTLEAEQRLGRVDEARATARRYLERYPSGAHARLARSLLGS